MRHRVLSTLWCLTPALFPVASLANVVSGPASFIEVRLSDSLDLVSGADVSFINAYDETDVKVSSGASASHINAYDQSHASVLGGSISFLTLHDGATASVNGGDISWLRAYDNSSIRLTNTSSLSWLVLGGASARAEIVASNVTYVRGQLGGTWADGTGFSFWAIREDQGSGNYALMPSNIVIKPVPLPAALHLLASSFALLLVPRRRKLA